MMYRGIYTKMWGLALDFGSLTASLRGHITGRPLYQQMLSFLGEPKSWQTVKKLTDQQNRQADNQTDIQGYRAAVPAM